MHGFESRMPPQFHVLSIMKCDNCEKEATCGFLNERGGNILIKCEEHALLIELMAQPSMQSLPGLQEGVSVKRMTVNEALVCKVMAS